MTDTITIKKPFDAHVHLRQGAMLRAVTKYTASRFDKAIVMPNTEPPIETLDAAIAYKNEILAAPEVGNFEPLMTLYLTKNLVPQEVERAAIGAEGTKIYGVKYYPYGATTNSQWGYRDILEAKEVLAEMERAGIPLLLHGEVHVDGHDHAVDPYQGEQSFVHDVLPRLLEAYPRLKVSLEHVSSADAADFLEKNGKEGRLVGTVTVHHLLYTRDTAETEPMLKVKPLIKNDSDKEKIRALVKKGLPFVFAGTDSAPHPEAKKISPTGAYGIFSAPAAVELYTQIFDELGALDTLENFLSVNGPRFYGVEPSSESITLEKKDWQITEPVVTEEDMNVWPIGHTQHILGNETIHWKIA